MQNTYEENVKAILFESLVNSDRCKTLATAYIHVTVFESLVNSDRCKTRNAYYTFFSLFESLVNSDRCKTGAILAYSLFSLRALLIQIGAKLMKPKER